MRLLLLLLLMMMHLESSRGMMLHTHRQFIGLEYLLMGLHRLLMVENQRIDNGRCLHRRWLRFNLLSPMAHEFGNIFADTRLGSLGRLCRSCRRICRMRTTRALPIIRHARLCFQMVLQMSDRRMGLWLLLLLL